MASSTGGSEERRRLPAKPKDPSFERLLRYLKKSRSFDFTGYKRASLMRRVRHQMRQVGCSTFEDYHDYLQVHPDEFTELFNTILINVTSFFRDAEAWDYLDRTALPRLLGERDGPVRVWSAGCATGQEAYSLAILLAEHLGIEAFRDRVKIYATDVDEDALAVARRALYTKREVGGIPEDLRERYFEPNNDSTYGFHRELRGSVTFGRNDLIQNGPIPHIDLLACRNTLMYFNAEAQGRIVSRLGYALRPRGILFLGKAEMLLNHAAVFEPLDLKRRFFCKVADAVNDDMLPTARRQVRQAAAETASELQNLRGEAFMTGPVAQMVLDSTDSLVTFNHRAAHLLSLGDRDIGLPFQDLEVSFRLAELRSHISAVRDTHIPVRLPEVEWIRSPSDMLYLDIQLLPLIGSRSQLLGIEIILTDVTRFRGLRNELKAANHQLETAYEELQSTNEELETTNEELQSTVEELETTNEELQSTNEELETTNEELQSMNDELQATNEELRERTSEISSLNNFMESVLSSLRAGVVVVNREMIIQVWNRQAEDLWGLREQETVGEHLLNLDSGLPTERLKTAVREVIFDGQQGREVKLDAVNRRGRTIQLHVTVTPLMSGSEHPDGVLMLMESTEPSAN